MNHSYGFDGAVEHLSRTSSTLTEDQMQSADDASDSVMNFPWWEVEEGANYWCDVYLRLRRIAREGF